MDATATKGLGDVNTVDVHATKDLIGLGYRYVDVRSAEEFNKSHINNALNVPYMFITQEGYAHVTNMGGGYSAWVDSGLAGGDKPAEELKTICKFRP